MTRPRLSPVRQLLTALTVLAPFVAAAQDLSFPAGASGEPTDVAKAMPALAGKILATYEDGDRVDYLDNVFRLQIVAGQYAEALQSLAKLRPLIVDPKSPQSSALDVQDEIFAGAKIIESDEHMPFDAALQRAFRETVRALDDRTSALVVRTLTVPEPDLRSEFESTAAEQKAKNTIALADALAMVRAYQRAEEFRAFGPLTGALIAEDDQRRYLGQENIRVRTSDGATICAHVMRPKSTPERLPTLLQFTIYNDANPAVITRDLRRTASNGYAAVVGFTRGKACSPDEPVPYEHDGADAATLIDWITKQPWSDGRVGMYGGSYSGFTPWAAAKLMPKGLKAMMVGAAAALGVDVPMEGNVVWNFIFACTTTLSIFDRIPTPSITS